ncbi:hypothetical protein [Leucobacter chromiiresistens]
MSLRPRTRKPTASTPSPEAVVVPPVLPQILLEAVNADTLIVTVNGNKLAATPIRRDQIAQTVTELVARLDSPTRVEVREMDGSIHADVLTPPAPRSPFAPAENTQNAAPVPSLLEFTGEGFIAGEDVAVALIIRHASADHTGTVRALLDRGEVPQIAGEVLLFGRISGTASVQSIT